MIRIDEQLSYDGETPPDHYIISKKLSNYLIAFYITSLCLTVLIFFFCYFEQKYYLNKRLNYKQYELNTAKREVLKLADLYESTRKTVHNFEYKLAEQRDRLKVLKLHYGDVIGLDKSILLDRHDIQVFINPKPHKKDWHPLINRVNHELKVGRWFAINGQHLDKKNVLMYDFLKVTLTMSGVMKDL